MKLAVIGLGRMGMNMAKRLLQRGHEVRLSRPLILRKSK